MSDRYDKIRHDVAFRKEVAAWASSFLVKNPLLDRMDRKSKTKLFLEIAATSWIQGFKTVKWRARGRFDPLLSARGLTVKSDSSYSFRRNEMAGPERLELPAFWFEAR
jgi:hypothetical protein